MNLILLSLKKLLICPTGSANKNFNIVFQMKLIRISQGQNFTNQESLKTLAQPLENGLVNDALLLQIFADL